MFYYSSDFGIEKFFGLKIWECVPILGRFLKERNLLRMSYLNLSFLWERFYREVFGRNICFLGEHKTTPGYYNVFFPGQRLDFKSLLEIMENLFRKDVVVVSDDSCCNPSDNFCNLDFSYLFLSIKIRGSGLSRLCPNLMEFLTFSIFLKWSIGVNIFDHFKISVKDSPGGPTFHIFLSSYEYPGKIVIKRINPVVEKLDLFYTTPEAI